MQEGWTVPDILQAYGECKSVREVSKQSGISLYTIRKTLISNGMIPEGRPMEIKCLQDAGLTKEEIMEKLNISEKAYNLNTPYVRGDGYKFSEPTENAMRIRKMRERRKTE